MDLALMFGTGLPVIGVLHVPALPGSPRNSLKFEEIRHWVYRDADSIARGGADGFIVENFGDAPFFPRRVPAHTVAYLAVLAREIRQQFRLPVGINVLRNDGIGALAAAAAAEADFIRVNVYTGARLGDQGILEGEAHRIQRYRKRLGGEIRVFADVAVKHSAPLAARPLEEEVRETIERGGADAVIVTGSATGQRTDEDDLRTARGAAGGAPVLAGSGADPEDAARLLRYAQGLIVGTAFKKDGLLANPVDPIRVEALMRVVKPLRY